MAYTQEDLEELEGYTLNSLAGTFRDEEDYGFNPCDKWADCGQLIDECKIIADGNGYALSVGYGDYEYVVNCEVKRAVTIVYILIKQKGA